MPPHSSMIFGLFSYVMLVHPPGAKPQRGVLQYPRQGRTNPMYGVHHRAPSWFHNLRFIFGRDACPPIEYNAIDSNVSPASGVRSVLKEAVFSSFFLVFLFSENRKWR